MNCKQKNTLFNMRRADFVTIEVWQLALWSNAVTLFYGQHRRYRRLRA